MHVLILRPYRKDNIYFRTIEEREKIRGVQFVPIGISTICLYYIHITKSDVNIIQKIHSDKTKNYVLIPNKSNLVA